jgi:hypothetical protein
MTPRSHVPISLLVIFPGCMFTRRSRTFGKVPRSQFQKYLKVRTERNTYN